MHPGDQLADKYRLRNMLGRGAMGEVWAATDEPAERLVAIKVLHPVHVKSQDLRERFSREGRAHGRILHENVVEVFDMGETERGSPFLVMQLLTGQTLARRIAQRGRLDVHDACWIAAQICAGLSAAHEAAIVHRDLKPANVFLHIREDGEEVAKILDFGVSKILEAGEASNTVTGSPLGSPAYMAPEQARGERTVDHRADFWAFGVTLFEMLSGQLPFRGQNIYHVVAMIMNGSIPRLSEMLPDVDRRLDDLVAKCLTRNADRRIQTAAEALEVLQHFVDEGPPASLPAPIIESNPGREAHPSTHTISGIGPFIPSASITPRVPPEATTVKGGSDISWTTPPGQSARPMRESLSEVTATAVLGSTSLRGGAQPPAPVPTIVIPAIASSSPEKTAPDEPSATYEESANAAPSIDVDPPSVSLTSSAALARVTGETRGPSRERASPRAGRFALVLVAPILALFLWGAVAGLRRAGARGAAAAPSTTTIVLRPSTPPAPPPIVTQQPAATHPATTPAEEDPVVTNGESVIHILPSTTSTPSATTATPTRRAPASPPSPQPAAPRKEPKPNNGVALPDSPG